MFLLFASILGLCLGPLLFVLLHRSQKPQLALDGFVLIAVVGLVALHVLPEAVEVAHGWALMAAAIGLVLPLAAEKLRALSHQTSHGVVLGIAFMGLLLHASLDGVGLGGSDGLGLAVVLHRIPVGLGVWWLVRPQFGRGWAVAVLAALGVATVVGYSLQTTMVAPGGVVWVQVVQALVAGSLLHVVLHQSVGFHDHGDATTTWHVPGALGAIVGALLVGGMPDPHGHSLGVEIVETAAFASPYLLGVIGLALLIRRKHALSTLDVLAPWAAAALTIGAMLVHTDTSLTFVTASTSAALLALVLVSLAHQGPREFVLRVLPLDLIQGGHDHAPHHDHHHDHGPVTEAHP